MWRNKNEAFNNKRFKTTVKDGEGSVMVWGSIAALEIGNLIFIESTMKKANYLDILKQNIAPSVEKLELSQILIFQQNNDPTIPRP